MIYIENEQTLIAVEDAFKEEMRRVINFALKEEEVNISYEISLLLVDNSEIRAINKEQRNIDKETDVLSFPMLDYPEGKVFKEVYSNYKFNSTYLAGEDLILGDIVVSLEKALEQSKDYGHSFHREVFYLIIHSILHLLGYDHMEEEEKSIMRKREEDILGKLNILR